MRIPWEAVEAAARAIALYSDDDNWEYNTSAAEDALRAAYKFIAAQVWEEGCKAGNSPFKEQNPYGDPL